MKFTIENYEEFALVYLEGDMAAKDRDQFDIFLKAHPEIRDSLDNFEIVQLPMFEPGLRYKEKLFRKPPRIKFAYLYIRNIAAAILILIAISFFWVQFKKEPASRLTQLSTVNTEYKEGNLVGTSTTPKVNKELIAAKSIDEIPEIFDDKKPVNNRIVKDKEIHKNTETAQFEKPSDIISSGVSGAPIVEKNLTNRDLSIAQQTSDKILEEEVLRNGKTSLLGVIDQIYFTPVFNFHYQIEIKIRPIFEEEMIEKDGVTKIGRLLAKANLIPTGLREEISEYGIREKILPESYSDLDN